MELLNSKKAQIYALAEQSGFPPERLEWGERLAASGDLVHVPALLVKKSEYFFAFDFFRGHRLAVFSPGRERVIDSESAAGWDDMLHFLNIWILCLQRELATPDPWSELEKQSVSFDLELDDSTPERPFSVAEHRKVTQTLSVIQGLLITYAKETNAKQGAILAGIKRLEEAAANQDRKSWFQQVVGYIVSTATAMGLDPEKTKALFTALRDGLHGAILFLN